MSLEPSRRPLPNVVAVADRTRHRCGGTDDPSTDLPMCSASPYSGSPGSVGFPNAAVSRPNAAISRLNPAVPRPNPAISRIALVSQPQISSRNPIVAPNPVVAPRFETQSPFPTHFASAFPTNARDVSNEPTFLARGPLLRAAAHSETAVTAGHSDYPRGRIVRFLSVPRPRFHLHQLDAVTPPVPPSFGSRARHYRCFGSFRVRSHLNRGGT
jgi:hypothetical protein